MDGLSINRSLVTEFISSSAEAIIVFGIGGEIVDCNEPMAQILSSTPAVLIGKHLPDYLTIHSENKPKSYIKRAFEGEASICPDTIYIESKGHFQVSFTPLKSNASVMAIFRKTNSIKDIKNESRFKPLIEESPIATAIYCPSGRPVYFNKAYGAIWGAEKSAIDEVITRYNIFEDDQLIELGVMPFVEKAFSGSHAEIPPVPYTPAKTHSISHLGLNEQRYVRGHIFPIKDVDGAIEEVVIVLTDITYQKKAEQILTDTHLKFQMLTMGLPGVIYEYLVDDKNGSKFKYISQGCEEMFGISPDEAISNELTLLERIHPDDREDFIATSKQSDSDFKHWHWEGRIVVDGKIKWIEGKSSPAKTKKGQLVRYGLLLDITEKKLVEEQFKLTEERLHLALQGAEIGIWEWDTKKRKTIFNPAWSNKFGYEPHELEKKFEEWADMIHPDDLPEVKSKLSEHLSDKTPAFEAEYRLLTKNGDYRWILDKGKAVARTADGKVTKASGTYLDINDKKTSELIIKRNEQLFTQLFENSPLGIVMLDEEHNVIQMNRGFENIFGYDKDEIVGNQLNNIIVPEELMGEALNINITTTSGRVGRLESYRKNKNGTTVPVLIYGVPVSLNNTTIGIYGIYVDITDRKKAEQELQIRNTELDNFVYKVSHDLRAPLSSILGLVHLANHEQNEDDIREYVGKIESRVKQLDSFINDVLSHSKNLKLAVSIEPIDLDVVVEKCFEDLSYLPNAVKIEKKISISKTPFYSDRWRINEIFRNLISNAIKYINPEEPNPCVKLEINITTHVMSLVLKDNGIGIASDTLPKVFDMFYRATEYSEGSGIGLYIVKNAIEKLGGNINITSELGKGTTFEISIPNKTEEYQKIDK